MHELPRDYDSYFNEVLLSLSLRERQILAVQQHINLESAVETIHKLESMGFVRCEGGQLIMGQGEGLVCSIEVQRLNETPQRQIEVPSFYIAKTVVSNSEYERFDPHHVRPESSRGGRHPANCITYGRAVGYVRWLNKHTELSFCLPTEPQGYIATTKPGWKYSYQENGEAIRRAHNVFGSYPEKYPNGEKAGTLEVDDPIVPVNYLGLHHMGGNLSTFTLGHYAASGHWGAAIDGSYTIITGGNFRSCPDGSRVVTRGIVDISGVFDIVGIRLVHPDPLLYVQATDQ